jgi:hypothetical protein
MAANRADGLAGAIGRVWSRGGVAGCKFGPMKLPTIAASSIHLIAPTNAQSGVSGEQLGAGPIWHSKLTRDTYSLPGSHSLGLDRSLHQGRRPPLRRFGSRILRQVLRRARLRRWYLGRHGRRSCASIRHYGLLHVHEDG